MCLTFNWWISHSNTSLCIASRGTGYKIQDRLLYKQYDGLISIYITALIIGLLEMSTQKTCLPLHLGISQYSFVTFSFVVKHHGWASVDDTTVGLRQ